MAMQFRENAFQEEFPELFSGSAFDRVPEVGDKIYVPTSLYLSHGADDFIGGWAIVINSEEGISRGERVHYVIVAEQPKSKYNWEGYLAGLQEKLKEEFGDQHAHSDPDLRPQFNDW